MITIKKEDILKELSAGVLHMDEALAIKAAHAAVETGLDAFDAITSGLLPGMQQAGVLYEKEEYFVPELVLCSEAMYAALDILSPHLKKDSAREKTKCVIGVVEGDTHDIGKNLVRIMLDVAGYEIHDLGRNVPLHKFVEKAKETGAELICMSTMMTTTMDNMSAVIKMLEEEGMRVKIKVLVGGGPISQAFADMIGADGYGENAASAVRIAKSVCSNGRDHS